jgi:GDP-mannose 6-dehydrogenase
MKISIFGLGYVGAVSAGCLARVGHHVIGVDPNEDKVDMINEGVTPIIEKDLGEILSEVVKQGRLKATTNASEAVCDTDMSFICVGTPSMPNGSLNLAFVRAVCEDIGRALANKTRFHIVVARSTMLPGTMRSVVIPALEASSGKRAGIDFGVCNNPEFLREGTAVHDFHHPPKTVIGESDERSGAALVEIYGDLEAPLVRTTIEVAEMVKYTDNVWHALKVGFANEIGTICKSLGIDSHSVMDIFFKDTKLNISSYYLRPGFAFGGSCLPKDLRALTYKAARLDAHVPILNAILASNQNQIDRGVRLISSRPSKKVGILGFSFKAGTDDLRESPVVEVIERLLGKGFDIKIYDENVNLAKIVGANRDFILNHIPHISALMVDSPDDVLAHAETIVIGNGSEKFAELLQRVGPQQHVIDLVRITKDIPSNKNYDGINW